MQNTDWKKWLYGFTGMFIVFGIWTPMLWFFSSTSSMNGVMRIVFADQSTGNR